MIDDDFPDDTAEDRALDALIVLALRGDPSSLTPPPPPRLEEPNP